MRAKLVEAGEKNEAPTDASGSLAFYCGLVRNLRLLTSVTHRKDTVLGLLREGSDTFMTNSRKSQSEKLETNRGRENAAKTPRNGKNPVPTLHTRREYVGGRNWGRSPSPTLGPCTGSSE